MRAVTYDQFGPAKDVLQLENIPTPDPKAGEVLVALKTSAVNPSDVRARAGGRPGVTKPPFPKIIPHSDGAGIIEAVGEGVDPSRIGERVWIWNGQWQRPFGTAAEYIALPSDQAVRLGDNLSFDEGAILGIPGLTACYTVLGNGPIEGQRILVSGGAGSVGNLAIQIAAASGAEVYATARGKAGIAAAKDAGAHEVFDYTSPTLADDLLAAPGGRPFDRIVEVEFGKNIETDTRVIAEGGRIVTYGSAKDMTPTLPFYPLMFKAVTIETALIYLLGQQQRADMISALSTLIESGALNLRVSDTLDLADCARAHALVEQGARDGAVILRT
ncbi:NADPH:quinone reductase [Yoonia litorea]|uniref:NADPH2:quinone reductase n=1 Tax=Yoonia litorea TaxID=1123755 RepID=A0A1I6N267_9RHOB|nr:NADPH:quinone reductase [Yoonia litorea]SFS22026.1 NADPH2:quinone reductase [Yoonia litorea]